MGGTVTSEPPPAPPCQGGESSGVAEQAEQAQRAGTERLETFGGLAGVTSGLGEPGGAGTHGGQTLERFGGDGRLPAVDAGQGLAAAVEKSHQLADFDGVAGYADGRVEQRFNQIKTAAVDRGGGTRADVANQLGGHLGDLRFAGMCGDGFEQGGGRGGKIFAIERLAGTLDGALGLGPAKGDLLAEVFNAGAAGLGGQALLTDREAAVVHVLAGGGQNVTPVPFEPMTGGGGLGDGGAEGGDLGQAAGQGSGFLTVGGGLVDAAGGEVLLAAAGEGSGQAADQLLPLAMGGEVRGLGQGEGLVEPGVG